MTDHPPMFDYINRQTGERIATGPLEFLNNRLSHHLTAEAAITLSRITADLDARARADSLNEREVELKAQEKAMLADMQRRLDAMIADATARVDREQQRRIQAKLDAMLDFDDPASHGDNLQSPLPPSEPEHEERLSAMSGERPPPDAQDALADDEEGSAPSRGFLCHRPSRAISPRR
jgi:hypothetical protein